MISAIAQMMIDNGYDAQDIDLDILKTNLSNTMTNITKTFLKSGKFGDTHDSFSLEDLNISIYNTDSIVNKPEQVNPYNTGYAYLGYPYNNLLLQWGQYSFLQLTEYIICNTDHCIVTLPVTYTRNYQVIVCDSGQACYPCGARQLNHQSFLIYCKRKLDGSTLTEDDGIVFDGILRWFTIGIG